MPRESVITHRGLTVGLVLFAGTLLGVMFLATLITTVPVISPAVVPQGSWKPPAPLRHVDWPRGDGEDGGELPPAVNEIHERPQFSFGERPPATIRD
jgi:hypothetical protein